MNDDDVHYIDDGGIRASEPPGEGAVGWNVMILTAVEVEVDMSISFSFVKIRIFDADFGLQSRILTPSRVEMIDKRSILCLETTTNRYSYSRAFQNANHRLPTTNTSQDMEEWRNLEGIVLLVMRGNE
jgi:hypothetical protein